MSDSVEMAASDALPEVAGRTHDVAGLAPEPIVSLMPGSCIQFLDFNIAPEAQVGTARRFFEEIGEDGATALHAVSLEDGVFYHPVTEQAIDASRTYLITGEAALAPFIGKWVPVPYLRQPPPSRRHAGQPDEGPTNWARVFITRLDEVGGTAGHRVVLAFDTSFDSRQPARGAGDAAPTLEDVRSGAVFCFTDDEADIAGFVTEAWIDDWIAELHREHVARRRGGSHDDDWDDTPALEHLACYLTMLSVLRQGCPLPAVRFTNTLADVAPRAAVGVDLVLDIGNSRTSALLRHHARDGALDGMRQHQVFPLPLRDLTEPWRIHAGIFSSRVEFARADFGKEALSRWSGRTNAFHWPSLCRVGAEASELAARQQASDDVTGLSSPARYLWDERPAGTLWRFVRAKDETARRGALVSGPELMLLSEQGDVLGPNERRGSATKPWFSRSSLMTFFAAEVLLHAVVAINAPRTATTEPGGERRRRLDRIVLTLPSGLHPREQAILRHRVEGAVDLVWHALGWSDANSPLLQPRPEIAFALDNASNAQVTYLYNEISEKFRGKARDYFDLTGRLRPQFRNGRSLRIASVDIGGGTTSLAVATYELSDRGTIQCTPQVREGMKIGGDDVAKAIIERILLPAIETRLADCRLPQPRRFLDEVLSGAVKGRPSWVATFGRRFASELAMPAAVGLLKEHDGARTVGDDVLYERTLRSLLAGSGATESNAVEEFEALAADEGAEGFTLLETPVSFLHRDLAQVVRSVLEPVFAGTTRVIQALDCDLVLLSGWLSRNPVVLGAYLETMPARPGRIVPMHGYRVGTWFPYAEPSGQLGDPKLAAVLGAMVASVEGQDDFDLRFAPPEASALRVYLGRINAKGQISSDDMLFVVDEQPRPGVSGSNETVTVMMDLPALVGQRRVPLEAWPASPIYVLDSDRKDARVRPKGPIKATIERVAGDRGGVDDLRVVKACDADGTMLLPGDITLKIQTLANGGGHWLDTGAFAIA